jgi:outer membrane protein
MKSNLSVMTLGMTLFAANAVHAQTETPGTRPAENAPMNAPPPSGPLPSQASPQPIYGPVPAEQPQARQWRATNEGKFMFGGSWDIGVPIGSAHSFTANASAVGFELLGQYWLTSHVTVGASLDWQTYWDTRPRQTYAVDNGAVTATADNQIRNGAARAVARYFFLDQGMALPYAGLNLGLGWSTFQTAASTVSLYDNTLSILLGAEVGALFAFERDVPLLTVGARYTTLPAADFLAVTNVQSLTFQIGLMTP